MFFEAEFSQGIGECCFCGAPSQAGKVCSVTFRVDHVVYSEFGVTEKERQIGSERSLCAMCSQYWNRLNHKLRREATVDEFAVWVLTQMGKKTAAGKHFNEGWNGESNLSVYGEVFGDFAKVLFEESNINCKITCPNCGDVTNLEAVHEA